MGSPPHQVQKLHLEQGALVVVAGGQALRQSRHLRQHRQRDHVTAGEGSGGQAASAIVMSPSALSSNFYARHAVGVCVAVVA